MDKKILGEMRKFEKVLKEKKYIFHELNVPIDNFTQIDIIAFLGVNNDKDINQKDIEEELGLTRATISGVLDTMEKRNIIARIPSKDDARKKIIKLTDKSFNAFKDIARKMEKVESSIVKDISKEKLEIFYDVLETMEKNIKNEL